MMPGKQMVAGVILSRVEALPSNIVFISMRGLLDFSTWLFMYYYLPGRSLGLLRSISNLPRVL